MITKEISLFEIADLQKPENAELKALCIEKNRDINVSHNWKGFEDLDKGFLGCFRYLAKWLYKTLENEYDYLTSDNVVFETLECNGYTFNEFGEIEH